MIGSFVKTIHHGTSRVQCLEVVDKEVWSTGEGGSKILKFDFGGEIIGTIEIDPHGEDYLCCMKYLGNHQQVWVGCLDGLIRIFRIPSGEPTVSLNGHTGTVTSLCYSTANSTAWSCSADSSIRSWNPSNGKSLRVIRAHSSWIRDIKVFDDFLWSGGDDCRILIHNQRTGELLSDIEGGKGSVLCLCHLPSRQEIWTGNADHSISVWDTQFHGIKKTLRGHKGWVLALTSIKTGVWSASSDKTILLWTFSSSEPLKSLNQHQGWVWSLVQVGPHIWSGSGDRCIKSWIAEESETIPIQTTPIKASIASFSSQSPDIFQLKLELDKHREQERLQGEIQFQRIQSLLQEFKSPAHSDSNHRFLEPDLHHHHHKKQEIQSESEKFFYEQLLHLQKEFQETKDLLKKDNQDLKNTISHLENELIQSRQLKFIPENISQPKENENLKKIENEELIENLKKEKEELNENLKKIENENENLKKEKEELIENLKKEKEELIENLKKEKEELIENFKKEKEELIENLKKEKEIKIKYENEIFEIWSGYFVLLFIVVAVVNHYLTI